MSQLYLPDGVASKIEAEREQSASAAAATEMALQRYQAVLATAYRAGYDLAVKTPRRLQIRLNVNDNFWRWYRAEIEGAEDE